MRHDPPVLRWSARHPFTAATLADEDLSVDFAPPTPRRTTAWPWSPPTPLTTNETWTVPFAPGELRVFVNGQAYPAA
jgi:predicted glutamine amidotransferase